MNTNISLMIFQKSRKIKITDFSNKCPLIFFSKEIIFSKVIISVVILDISLSSFLNCYQSDTVIKKHGLEMIPFSDIYCINIYV